MKCIIGEMRSKQTNMQDKNNSDYVWRHNQEAAAPSNQMSHQLSIVTFIKSEALKAGNTM